MTTEWRIAGNKKKESTQKYRPPEAKRYIKNSRFENPRSNQIRQTFNNPSKENKKESVPEKNNLEFPELGGVAKNEEKSSSDQIRSDGTRDDESKWSRLLKPEPKEEPDKNNHDNHYDQDKQDEFAKNLPPGWVVLKPRSDLLQWDFKKKEKSPCEEIFEALKKTYTPPKRFRGFNSTEDNNGEKYIDNDYLNHDNISEEDENHY